MAPIRRRAVVAALMAVVWAAAPGPLVAALASGRLALVSPPVVPRAVGAAAPARTPVIVGGDDPDVPFDAPATTLVPAFDTILVSPAYGTYAWPVSGPVIRGFEPPPDPYSAGHRGIDIATPFGSPMVAAQDGTVAFSGWVGGQLFISIDHADGVRTTYSWLSAVSVKKGDRVRKGGPIGRTGHGHPEVATPHLHFGARIGSTYIDPMLLLTQGALWA